MSYWNKLGLLRGDNNNCFLRAFLQVRTDEDIEEVEFKYKVISDNTLTDTASIMPMTYDKRTKGIFVYDYRLPFVNGARVRFLDGTTMTISSIVEVVDEFKAQNNGMGVIGLNVYLGG